MNKPLWFALLVVVGVLSAEVVFEPQRVVLIDRTKKNYLLRGNIPLVDGEFRLDLLKKRIEEVTKLKPNSYDLKVISLMNHYTDKQSKNLAKEEAYFELYPAHGEFSNYPVLGFVTNPQSLPEFLVDISAYFYERFSFDKLGHFSEQLHENLQQEKDKPQVYYIHCSHGIDRTGMVSGVYKMKYTKKSLKQILEENERIGGREMLWTTYSGLLWYCEHLQRDRPSLDCGEKGGEYYKSKGAPIFAPGRDPLDDEL